jgi:hypothetical protein
MLQWQRSRIACQSTNTGMARALLLHSVDHYAPDFILPVCLS